MRDSEKMIRKLSAGGVKTFAELAVERGYVTQAQIEDAKRLQAQAEARGTKRELAAILQERGLLSPEQERAIERALRGATVIAGFEILEKVGQGGMGAVFRARQIGMDRVVALKILPPKLAADESFKERFLREARLSAKLNHLNIINGIDCGEEAGYTFFAMEFVEGKTARQLVKKTGKLAVEDAGSIVKQIADALAYANKHNLVHRDIKPENIMVTPQGVAKLCDLGLAKQSEGAEDASLTQSGQAVGTPHYISPEQARGEKNVDIRSDIYSLGASLYHLLTGETPFEGSTAASIMARHLAEEARSVCDLDPEIPEAWGAIVAKMMAKDPADRYATPEALLEDLDAALHGGVVQALGFRGKSSCAMPKRGARRAAGPTQPVLRQVKTSGEVKRSTTGHLAPVNVGDRTTRHVTAVGPRQDNSSTGLFVAGGIAAALVLGAVILSGSGGSPPRNVQPNRNVAREEPPAYKPPEPPKRAPERPVAAKQTTPEPAKIFEEAEIVNELPPAKGERLWRFDFNDGQLNTFNGDPGKPGVEIVAGRKALKVVHDRDRVGVNHPMLMTEDGVSVEFAVLAKGLKNVTVSYRVSKGAEKGRYNQVVLPEPGESWRRVRSVLAEARKVDGPMGAPDGMEIDHVEIFATFREDAKPGDGLVLDDFEVYTGANVQRPLAQAERKDPPSQGATNKPNDPPARKLEAEAALTMFLGELSLKVTAADLQKALPEVRKLAAQSEFSAAAAELKAELTLLEAAGKLEAEALKVLGGRKGTVLKLSEAGRKKFPQVENGKVDTYDMARGLYMSFNGPSFPLQAFELDAVDLLSSLVEKTPAPQVVQYLIYRGRMDEAQLRLEQLPEKEREPLMRRIALLKAHQAETAARQAFAEVSALTAAKKWPQVAEAVNTFKQRHGATKHGKMQAEQLDRWVKDAQAALQADKAAEEAKRNPAIAVLFVVGEPNLNNGDMAIKNRLEQKLNATVAVRDDDASQASDADGKTLVILSSTISRRTVREKFRDIKAAVIMWERGLLPHMGMVPWGETSMGHESRTGLHLDKSEAMLSGGLSGHTELLRQGMEVLWGRPGNAAIVVARMDEGDERAAMFAFETGANMHGLVAPARRVSMPFSDESPAFLTDNGWKLFEAAVRWSTGRGALPVQGNEAVPVTPKPGEKADPSKLFKTKSTLKADGSLEAIWAPQDAQAFAQDWKLHDSRNRKPEEVMRLNPAADALVGIKCVGGEIWDGENRSAVAVALANVKPTRFRLEAQYYVPKGLREDDRWSAGIGLWNGDNRGLLFGVRRFKDGPLTVWGSIRQGENVDERNLPRNALNVTWERGQLAIVADGQNWTYYYREAGDMDANNWRQIHKMSADAGGYAPALLPWSWHNATVEISYQAVRLTILPEDPLLKK